MLTDSLRPAMGRLAVPFALATAVAAQTTWIVDAANGPGAHFTDLPPALAAVADGDRVIVRAGTYTPGRLDKAIALIGESNAVVVTQGANFEITGIGAGKTCVIRGLEFRNTSPFFFAHHVDAHDNDGLLVFAGVRTEVLAPDPGLSFVACKAVTISDSVIRPMMYAERSTVAAEGCEFRAYDGPLSPGIWTVQAELELSACSAFGTNGMSHLPSAPAVRAHGTALVIRGDATSRYVGGNYNGLPWSASISGGGDSTLVVDPAVVLSPPPTALKSITTRRMGALSASGGALGGMLDIELYSRAGNPYGLFVALPRTPFAFPPFGRQWLDLATEFLVTAGVQGPGEHTTWSTPVPNDPALRGLALAFQALSGPLLTIELSNPAVPVVH